MVLLFQHVPEGTEENHATYQSGYWISQTRYKIPEYETVMPPHWNVPCTPAYYIPHS
jgi:hypothetical protein